MLHFICSKQAQLADTTHATHPQYMLTPKDPTLVTISLFHDFPISTVLAYNSRQDTGHANW